MKRIFFFAVFLLSSFFSFLKMQKYLGNEKYLYRVLSKVEVDRVLFHTESPPPYRSKDSEGYFWVYSVLEGVACYLCCSIYLFFSVSSVFLNLCSSLL